jgi:hypothetical protein
MVGTLALLGPAADSPSGTPELVLFTLDFRLHPYG